MQTQPNLKYTPELNERDTLSEQNTHLDLNLNFDSALIGKKIQLKIVVNNNPVNSLVFISFGSLFMKSISLKKLNHSLNINSQSIFELMIGNDKFMTKIQPYLSKKNLDIGYLKLDLYKSLKNESVVIKSKNSTLEIFRTNSWKAEEIERNTERDVVMVLNTQNSLLIQPLTDYLKFHLNVNEKTTLVSLLIKLKKEYPDSSDRRFHLGEMQSKYLLAVHKNELLNILTKIGYLDEEDFERVEFNFSEFNPT